MKYYRGKIKNNPTVRALTQDSIDRAEKTNAQPKSGIVKFFNTMVANQGLTVAQMLNHVKMPRKEMLH